MRCIATRQRNLLQIDFSQDYPKIYVCGFAPQEISHNTTSPQCDRRALWEIWRRHEQRPWPSSAKEIAGAALFHSLHTYGSRNTMSLG